MTQEGLVQSSLIKAPILQHFQRNSITCHSRSPNSFSSIAPEVGLVLYKFIRLRPCTIPSEILQAQGIIPITPEPSLEESNNAIHDSPSRGSNNEDRNPSFSISGPSKVTRNAPETSPVPMFAPDLDVKPTIKTESGTGNDNEELALLEVCACS